MLLNAIKHNKVQKTHKKKKKYLCAEFSDSLFIQIGLFIDSGFVPKLKTGKHSTHENEDDGT